MQKDWSTSMQFQIKWYPQTALNDSEDSEARGEQKASQIPIPKL